jgi:lipopolysaccharide export LptBFGC system permease protein LptF
MIFTLQRYIFREVFRIFIMAAVGLSLILSLGLILQPVQEYGVGPRQVLKLLVYFMPITLTFVLPMAALFASSLAYGRFASDNELNACRASGIGLWTFVYPGLALAILVATANLLLSFHVMPYFVHMAEQSFKADAKQILFRNLQRRGYYELHNIGGDKTRYRIYADYADSAHDTLYGVVVVDAGNAGIAKMYTAERATIGFGMRENLNEVQLSIYNARIIPAGEGLSGLLTHVPLSRSFDPLLGDNIKFKRVNEMKQIQVNPESFKPIAEKAKDCYVQLVTELLAQDIDKELKPFAAGYYDLRGPAQWVRISAGGCGLSARQTISLMGPIIVEEYDAHSGSSLRKLQCQRAILYVGKDVPNPRLELDLSEPRNLADGSVENNVRIVNSLTLPDAVRRRLGQGDTLSVVQRVPEVLQAPPSSILAEAQRDLESDIADALMDIKAEMNSRLVFGIGCIPMILIGIGLGIINRGAHLLSAFGASCAPAAILIVAIISGRQVAGNSGARIISGFTIMWGGLAFLVILTAWLYRRLLRT